MKNEFINQIEQKIRSAPVVVFMKGTLESPRCGFSARACQVLQEAGVKQLVNIDVLSDKALREALEQYTHWPTLPQVFIHGKFIGGYDIVVEMFEKGELQSLLEENE